MASLREQIEEVETEIFNTAKNKATERHVGKLKAKLARLRADMEKQARASSGAVGKGYGVRKSGNATVGLVGFPSVGKSTLLSDITDAKSEIGAYQFTTLTVIPGIMEYNDAKIQILDMPGIIGGAARGKGRGREVLSVARSCDLILLFLDVYETNIQVLTQELFDVGIRLNEKPPGVVFTKKERGGIEIHTTIELTHVTEDDITGILSELGMHNMDVVIREDVTIDRLIDAATGNRVFTPALAVVNKIDLVDEKYLKGIRKTLEGWDPIEVSATTGQGIEELKTLIYDSLDLIPIYLKPQGQKADLDEPMIIRKGANVEEVCRSLHRDFKDRFRYGLVWGPSAKFPGQRVGAAHVLQADDLLTIVVRR